MLKFLGRVVAALLVVGAVATAAPAATLTGTTCPGAGCTVFNVDKQGSIGVQVSGTFSGTLTFTQSIDGSTFTTLTLYLNGTGSAATSTTTTGLWRGTVSGARFVRVAFTSHVSGSAVVTSAYASARSFVPGDAGTLDGGGLVDQIAVWSDADSLSGSALALLSTASGHLGLGSNAAIDSGAMNAWNAVNAVVGIQNNRTGLAATTINTNIFNSNDLTPAADIVGGRRHTGQYNDVEFLGTHNAANTEFYGVLSDLTMNGAGSALWAFGDQAAVYVMDNQANITEVYGSNRYVYTQSTTGNITNAYGGSFYPIQHYGGGTVQNSYGVYVWPVAGTGTITNNVGLWMASQARTGTCSYDAWADEQGVWRLRADNRFDSVYQATPALYNPLFTKYTPCAPNFERITTQWRTNVAEIGTEVGAGGGNVLRDVRFIGQDIKPNPTGFFFLHEAVKTAAPTGTDCDASGETNRIVYDSTNDNLYVCSGASGWRKIATTAP